MAQEEKRPKKGLTEKQENFCRYYLDTGNMSEAYRMAYDTSKMKPESVNRLAFAMMENVKITSRVEELRAERLEETRVSREKVESVLMDIVMSDPNDLYTVDPKTGRIKMKSPNQLPKRARNAMKKIQNKRGEVTYEFNGKTEAARLLASMNGWEAERKVSITNGEKPISELRIGFDDDNE